MENHGGSNPGDIEEQSSDHLPGEVAAVENPGRRRKKDHFIYWYSVRVVFRAFANIFFILFVIARIFIAGDTSDIYSVGSKPNRPDEEEEDNSTSRIPMKKTKIKVKMHRMCIVGGVRMGCLVLIWMAINLGVPSLRRISFLGSLLWKWSLLVALVLIAHPFLILLCMCVSSVIVDVFSIRFKESDVNYCIEGFIHCMIWVMYITSLILTWLLCVDTSIAPLHRYGMLTMVSLLVGAVLNVVKSLVLFLWRTKLIYSKYKGKILLAGCQLYLHLNIMKQNPPGTFQLIKWWILEGYRTMKKSAEWRKLLPIEEYYSQGASLGDVHDVATYLTNNFELSLTQDDDIPDIAAILQQKFQSDVRVSV